MIREEVMSKTYYIFCSRTIFIMIALFASGCAHKLDLETVYMDQIPIAKYMRITINGTLDGEAKVYFDPNLFNRVDQFGDPNMVTLSLGPTVEVEFEQIELEDRKGKERKVYQLIEKKLLPPLGKSPFENYKYYLVVPPSKQEAYRLVIEDGEVRRPITLERD